MSKPWWSWIGNNPGQVAWHIGLAILYGGAGITIAASAFPGCGFRILF